jgi:hypothetical protein
LEVEVTHRLNGACGAHEGGPVFTLTLPWPVDKGHLSFALEVRAIHLR